jgi:hypothetical protein
MGVLLLLILCVLLFGSAAVLAALEGFATLALAFGLVAIMLGVVYGTAKLFFRALNPALSSIARLLNRGGAVLPHELRRPLGALLLLAGLLAAVIAASLPPHATIGIGLAAATGVALVVFGLAAIAAGRPDPMRGYPRPRPWWNPLP